MLRRLTARGIVGLVRFWTTWSLGWTAISTQLAEVAPTEIKETITQLADDTLVGISSSEGRPDLELLLEEMDNYAGETCGVTFSD